MSMQKKKNRLLSFSEVPPQLYLESQKCEGPHSQDSPHFFCSYHNSLKNKLRIAGALHNIYIERIICAYKDSICFLLCTQILQRKMSGQ